MNEGNTSSGGGSRPSRSRRRLPWRLSYCYRFFPAADRPARGRRFGWRDMVRAVRKVRRRATRRRSCRGLCLAFDETGAIAYTPASLRSLPKSGAKVKGPEWRRGLAPACRRSGKAVSPSPPGGTASRSSSTPTPATRCRFPRPAPYPSSPRRTSEVALVCRAPEHTAKVRPSARRAWATNRNPGNDAGRRLVRAAGKPVFANRSSQITLWLLNR